MGTAGLPGIEQKVHVDHGVIYDVGFHNGDDTAFYLSKGYRVIAFEANPELVAAGRKRFHREIGAGELDVVHCGICPTAGTQEFYVNESDSGHSSFDREKGTKGGKYHVIEVPCVTLPAILEKHPVPFYLKVDIEGVDGGVVTAIRKPYAPPYLSCEIAFGDGALIEGLHQAGYTHFKLINQDTYTQSLPIFRGDTAARAARKASRFVPALKRIIPIRKIDFDRFRDEFPYRFGEYSSGPFGEDTEGEWMPVNAMRRHLSRVWDQYRRDGIERSWWYDIHARHDTAGTTERARGR